MGCAAKLRIPAFPSVIEARILGGQYTLRNVSTNRKYTKIPGKVIQKHENLDGSFAEKSKFLTIFPKT